MDALALVFCGAAVGLIIGLSGVGGGSLMTPLLIFGFRMPPHLAVGTDLLFAALTKAGGVLTLVRRRELPWGPVLCLSLGSLPAAALSLWVLQHLGPASEGLHQVMRSLLGAALLLTAAATLYKAWRQQHPQQISASAPHPAWAVFFGAAIGALVTLTSVGAGAIGVTVLLVLFPHLPLPRIVAADIAYAVPLTLLAGLGHAAMGSVDWALLAALLCGSLPGIWLGGRLIHRCSVRWVRTGLSLLLFGAGLKLVAF
jgi:uncharacterized membrane protein YfcA